ncbi:MAG TPA: AAA family ATPase [Marmoricola sp.]|nr:AAA family ATPase [Marmoricola sp.]
MAVRVAVCGTLSVTTEDRRFAGPQLGTPKARRLLAALAVARHGPVPADRLTDAVWGDQVPRDPGANLATLASRLRRTLGAGVVTPGSSAYALDGGAELDVDTAAALLERAESRLVHGEPTLAAAGAARALELLADGSLAPECSGSWADGLRREVEELCRTARHLHAAASTRSGEPDAAVTSARLATLADPFDERAHRDLIRALVAGGRTGEALEVHAQLVRRLADELGTDPDEETRSLHLAILRGQARAEPEVVPEPSPAPALVGRDDELGEILGAWSGVATGGARLLLVSGVPGIGKTRLLAAVGETARATGALVLAMRCRPAQRSLFLQPFVEALRPVLLSMPQAPLRALLGVHLPAWARLVPELAELFDVPPAGRQSADLGRRRAFDAVAAVLDGLAARRPVLVVLDDLQYGADATADLVAHLAVVLGPAPVLLLTAARSDGLGALSATVELAEQVRLGPLAPAAVDALVASSGLADRAGVIRSRTRGHPLSVVAILRALVSGSAGTPEDLTTAVRAQLELLAAGEARTAAAASVLGTRVDPSLLAGLLSRAEADVVGDCERLVAAGLMSPAGPVYEFINDLVQEAVLGTLPEPLAIAHHRRAADLLSGRPEEMAHHAHAAGEPGRAAAGYLQAGRTARRSGAVADAVALLTQALRDAREAGDHTLSATVLLERARAHEARPDYAAAEQDVVAAESEVTAASDPRLRMRAQLLLGGDVSVARHRRLASVLDHNRTGLLRATELGDAVSAALFRTRLVVLECSRLRLDDALRLASSAVTESRAGGNAEALARSLDGLKTVHAYCGDAPALTSVVEELMPLLDRLRLPWLQQWALLESALVPAAAGDWTAARARCDGALEVNRETGYAAYTGFFRAQRGWLARLAGDLDAALADGRRSVAETAPAGHPWWYATAAGCCAATLLELGRADEAAALCQDALAAVGEEVGAAYRLRCLAPYAAATGERVDEADRLLATLQAPAGGAWITGADVYDALASAWLARGEPERAAAVVSPLLAATRHAWAGIHERIAHRTSATSPAARSAPSPGTGR